MILVNVTPVVAPVVFSPGVLARTHPMVWAATDPASETVPIHFARRRRAGINKLSAFEVRPARRRTPTSPGRGAAHGRTWAPVGVHTLSGSASSPFLPLAGLPTQPFIQQPIDRLADLDHFVRGVRPSATAQVLSLAGSFQYFVEFYQGPYESFLQAHYQPDAH